MKKLMPLLFFIILLLLICSINVIVMSETSFNLYTYNSAAGQLLKIDPKTGKAVIMHNLSQKNSFADLSSFSESGSLITIGHFAPDTQLYQINLLTGEINLIGDTGLNFVEGVEYIPSTGQLFAGGRKLPHHTNDSYLFIEINPSDGSIIRQQKTNIRDIDSLAYNPVSGELWAVDTQPNRYARLWTVDLETGQGTLRKNFTKKELMGYSGLIGISFSPDGQAYGILYKGTKAPIKEYRLIKIDMNDFSFELLPAENLGQPETLLLTNITSDYAEGWIVQDPKIELTVTNSGKRLVSNLPIFVNQGEVGEEIDLDGDGINQAWEDMAMERINPYIELDEEEPWLINQNFWLMNQNIINSIQSQTGTEISSFVGKVPQQIINSLTDHVANFVRIHPYTPFCNYQDCHANQLPKYIIFRYVVTWSKDYGRFGFTSHEDDHERIYMAWRVIDNYTLDLDWVFTSAHRDPDIHHSVWSPYYRICNKVDVSTIPEGYDFSMLMCGELDFDSQDGRLTFCAAEGKHALYPACDVCEDVLLVSTTATGEDCCGGGRYLFDCYNVGEPNEWQYQDKEIYDLTVDEGKLGGELPQEDTDIFYNILTSRYRITIKTGNKDYSGTDAKINIKLHGQEEKSSNWFTIYSIGLPPRSAEHVGIFEKGDLDHIFVSCTDLGLVNKIQVKHDNGGVAPGWYISEIWVEDLDTKTIWHCQPNTWLEKVFSPSLHGLWDDKTNKTFDLKLLQ